MSPYVLAMLAWAAFAFLVFPMLGLDYWALGLMTFAFVVGIAGIEDRRAHR